jgi:hypothetical protein
MIHVRRIGLTIAALILVASVIAAFAIEGLALALVVLIGALFVAVLIVPLLAVFEEEHDLPAARAERGEWPPH